MKKTWKRVLSTVLAAVLTVGSISYASPSDTAHAEEITDTSEYYQAISRSRVAVHDPSIVKDHDGRYYIFGSHMAWAYSDDLETWTAFTNNINTNYRTLFAKEIAWASAGDTNYDPSGNMWAPDVIWNPVLNKWCMYMSVNGGSWNSAICMLTADSLAGNWTYMGTVVYSGFTASGTYDFANTDYKEVTGDTSLPDRYITTAYSTKDDSGKAREATTWAYRYGAHAIDACVFYDEEGKLWFSYGSWSGGIYIFELDESTGFRDTSVKYTYDTTEHTDPYMGQKLGGSSASGEASYIEYINGYYYLFISYGGLVANGGYNMRVFRSKTPDGPYTDASGDSATGGGDTNGSSGRIGTRLMGYYKWSYWDYAQVAQGHNSALLDDDGNAYLFYHTRTNDGSEGHTVRVHQLFTTKNGYLTAAPFEYSQTDEVKSTYTSEEIAGDYEILFQNNTDYSSLEYNQPQHLELKPDGTVSGDASGKWDNDGAAFEITLGNVTYEGTLVNQTMEQTNVKTLCFTTVGANGNVDTCLWGYKYPSAATAVSMAAANISLPKLISDDIELPESGLYGSSVTWESDSPFLLADGTVIPPKADAAATLTATISIGDVSYRKKLEVTISSGQTSASKVASYYTDKEFDMSSGNTATYDNPLKDMDTSNGVTFKFKVKRTGAFGFTADGNIFALSGDSGKFYFNGGAYLGYNAAGGIFDANIYNGTYASPWRIGTDFLGTSEADVEIKFTPSGYSVSVNGEEKYNNTTVDSRTDGSGKDDNIEGDVPGQNSITDFSYVLSHLASVSSLTFGTGSWWDGTFKGTISDFEIWVEAPEQKPASGNTYYSEDYEGSTDVASLWSGTATITKESSDSNNYVQIASDASNSGSRGVTSLFTLSQQPTETYIFETDAMIASSTYHNGSVQNQFTEFVVICDDYSYNTSNNANTGINSGYILKLSTGSEADLGEQNFILNDSDETIAIPASNWIHIEVEINPSTDPKTAVLTITDKSTGNTLADKKDITISGDGNIKGIYLLMGRGNANIKLDNTSITKPGIADYAAFNEALAKAKKYQQLQESTGAYSDASAAALNAAITQADNLSKDYGTEHQAEIDACTQALEDAIDGLTCKEHSYNNGYGTVVTKPTCTTEGKEKVTCYFCGAEAEAPIAATGHTAGEWIITKEATTEEEGQRVKKCVDCDTILETEVIPKLTTGGNTGGNSGDNTGDNTGGNNGDNSGDSGNSGGNNGDNSGNSGNSGGNNGDNSGSTGSTDSVKKGASYTVGNLIYKVTSVSKKTVTVTGVKKSKKSSIKTITIGKTVKIKGKSYKITAIANKAFSQCKKLTKVTIGTNVTKIGKKAFYKDSKLKKIIVKTKKLKSVGSSALKGINKKATIKVPKSKLKKYKKLFKKKGQSSKVKIKK